MKTKPIVLCIALLVGVCASADAAYLTNVPHTVVQPNGDTLHCFASGDEFYNWLHDSNGYTIIQDAHTGYYVYATMKAGVLIASTYVAGRVDPKTIGLMPQVNIAPAEILARRTAILAETRHAGVAVPRKGHINNLVVFIRFAGEAEFGQPISFYDDEFNASTPGANSVYNYFKEASYGQLTISSTFYPLPNGASVVSFQDTLPRSYFQPYNSVTNTNGYKNDGGTREAQLLTRAVTAIASSVPATLALDGDNDGSVDNICFMISGSQTGWLSLLWPHMSWGNFGTINGKRTGAYNVQLRNFGRGVGILCHEMFHSLGAPDLYHYKSNGIEPVGSWDLMQADRNPPQHMSAHMKYQYGTWINFIPEATTPGRYSLRPLTSPTNNSLIVRSSNSLSEYFVLEYRRKTGTFESSIPGSGLLVYRIDSRRRGNAGGPPDEVYLYRPGGSPTTNGSLDRANFSSDVSRTQINDNTDPPAFLSDGTPSGLEISDIGSAGDSISFLVGITVTQQNIPVCQAVGTQSSPQAVTDGAGGAIILWRDVRAGVALYCQRITASGTAAWATNGIQASSETLISNGAIVSDESGGGVIAWDDGRNGNSDFNVYAQRLSASGTLLWQTNGVPITTAAGNQEQVRLASDGMGGAFLVWVDYRKSTTDADIFAQHISSAGAVLWVSDGVPVTQAAAKQGPAYVIADALGGAIIAWQDARNGSSNQDIYAQRLDASGFPTWSTDGVALCTAEANQYVAGIVPNGDGGAYVLWRDLPSGGSVVYAQQIERSGETSWKTNGIPVCESSASQDSPDLTSDGEGGIVITWNQSGDSTSSDIYAQRLDSSGNRLWGANGVALCLDQQNQFRPRVAADGVGGYVITWYDGRGIYPNFDIYAQRVSATGITQWVDDGLPVCTVAGQQMSPCIVGDGRGRAVIAWQDNRSGSLHIFADFVGGIVARKPPVIASLTPASGPAGTRTTINGAEFSPLVSQNIVYIGNTRARVTECSNTSLTVQVPFGATYGPISVTTNKFSTYSRLPFTITFPGANGITTSSFHRGAVIRAHGGTFRGIADLDGDGRPDLVVCRFDLDKISVYRNTTSAAGFSLAEVQDFPTGRNPLEGAFADLDGDGKLDIVTSNNQSNTISIFRNTSTIGIIDSTSFRARMDLPTGSFPSGVTIHDFDGDGRPDIAVADFASDSISLFRNRSSASSFMFSEHVRFFVGPGPHGILSADLIGDRKPEIVVTNVSDSCVTVLHNLSSLDPMGTIAFARPVSFRVGKFPWYVAAADIDGDGNLDLLTGNKESHTVSVLRNKHSTTLGPTSFVPKVDFPTARYPDRVAVGEIDGDGKPDVVVPTQKSITILRNTSPHAIISPQSLADTVILIADTGHYTGDVGIADLNDDGKPDMFVGYSSSNDFMGVLLNDITQTTWQSTVTVNDACSGIRTLTFGQARLATDSLDLPYGESELPPVPLEGVFDVRFVVSQLTTAASLKDFRSDTATSVVWHLFVQPGICGHPFQVRWDSSHLPSGQFLLQGERQEDSITINMKSRDRMTVFNPATNALRIEFTKTTTLIPDGMDLPNAFVLRQNYPNPFNPQTTINYSLPSPSPNQAKGRVGLPAGQAGEGYITTLKVYDILGREVATLVNERKPPGSYEVRFDAAALASGVYLYRMIAGPFIDTKKMLIVR